MTGPDRGDLPEAPAMTLGPVDWMANPATRAVIAAITKGGAPARFVGGCVRDTLLGRPIGDIDIATPLPPDAVTAALQAAGLKAVPTGVDHGTITAVANGKPFEITTLRIDVETDGRHAVVDFTADWRQDAARRDFTFNALSADRHGRVYDYFDGIADARAGRIRFVGDPAQRLDEDALRLLRFFRFYAQFGQPPPDSAALAACAAFAPRLAILSGERVRAELLRLLAAADPVPAWRLMADARVARHAIGVAGAVDRLAALVALEDTADPVRRLAALLATAPDGAAAVAERLRLSNADRDRLLALTDPAHAVTPAMDPPALRRLLHRLGAANGRDGVLLARAGDPGDDRFAALADVAQAWRPVRFPLKGRDAVALGVPAGPAVGALLREVEAVWIAADFQPDRRACLAELRRLAAAAGQPVRHTD